MLRRYIDAADDDQLWRGLAPDAAARLAWALVRPRRERVAAIAADVGLGALGLAQAAARLPRARDAAAAISSCAPGDAALQLGQALPWTPLRSLRLLAAAAAAASDD